MKSTLRFTDRVYGLLSALTQKVRLLSLAQIAQWQFGGERANARRRLRQLADAGWIEKIAIRARSLPELTKPVVRWEPGEAMPDLPRAANALKGRWSGRVVRSMSAYVATCKTADRIGGYAAGRLKKPLQAGHDLGVAQIWVQLAESAPPLAEAWRGEDVMADTRRHALLPDAFLVNRRQEVVCVVEFGGAYDLDRLTAFHRDCLDRSLTYQIW